jgi:DNA-directed RNA polymerase subunit RPC12/RpoP
MGAYGSPETHPKILAMQQEEEERKRRKPRKGKTITCPHCGKEIYFQSRISPLKIVQYSGAVVIAVIAAGLVALIVLSFLSAFAQTFGA